MATRSPHPGLHDAKGRELRPTLLEVAGAPTHVVDRGEGPPVLLIHGYGDTADGWRRVVPGLLAEHRVVALDLPPFGRSGPPPGTSLVAFYHDFFPELLERLELERTTVIGHSLGGAIALEMASERPELVERVGLVAPAGLGAAPPLWWRLIAGNGPAWRAALSLPSPLTPVLIRTGLRRFLEWRLFHDPRPLRPDVERLVRLHSSPGDFDALLAAGRALIGSYTGTLFEDSAAVECPIWMVWGAEDGLVPVTHARAFERAHPAAEVHVFERCGHYPQIESPARFNRVLRRWLAATAEVVSPRTRRAA